MGHLTGSGEGLLPASQHSKQPQYKNAHKRKRSDSELGRRRAPTAELSPQQPQSLPKARPHHSVTFLQALHQFLHSHANSQNRLKRVRIIAFSDILIHTLGLNGSWPSQRGAQDSAKLLTLGQTGSRERETGNDQRHSIYTPPTIHFPQLGLTFS